MTLSVLFYGTPDFSVPALKALLSDARYSVKAVVTQPDRPAGRGNKTQQSPVKREALQHNLPVLQPVSIRRNLSSFLAECAAHGPFDAGVVIAFGQILPLQALTLGRAGSVNVHASILPRWRGAAPIQRALLAGDKQTGVCLMRMEEGLDTGPVYRCSTIPIGEIETAGALHDRLAALGAELLTESLEDITAGKIEAVPQPEQGATYASKITNEEQRINWKSPAEDCARLVRALAPSPAAFSFFDGRRMKILAASAKDKQASGMSGVVSYVSKDRLEVQCAPGILSIEKIQPEGKRKMQVEEFLRGNLVSVGMKFD